MYPSPELDVRKKPTIFTTLTQGCPFGHPGHESMILLYW
jgi:hypothetical protein